MLFVPIPFVPPPASREESIMLVKLGGIGLTSSTRAFELRRPETSSLYQTRGSLIPLASTENPISELRRRSGLTWEQLAGVMGVERRTLHLWEAGRGMRPIHQERLQQVLQVVRITDRGSSAETRAALLDVSQGDSIKDLLAQDLYEEALRQAKNIPAVAPPVRPPKLSREVRQARRPLPLAAQLDLREDTVPVAATKEAKPARITRVRKA